MPGGRVEQGRSDFLVRTTGEFQSVGEINDVVVSRIEDYLRREYEEGRMPAPARSTIDRVVTRLREETEGGADEKDPGGDTPRP